MVIVLHTLLENNAPAVMSKQTGVTQGSAMQIFNGTFPISLMLTLQETQVQSLLIVQLSKLLTRERIEAHMSSLESWISVGYSVESKSLQFTRLDLMYALFNLYITFINIIVICYWRSS